MTVIKQILLTILSALFAYFFPELAAEMPLPDYLAEFTAFAPLVIVLAALWNNFKQWEGVKAWFSTLVIGIGLAFVGFFLEVGMFTDALIWHVPFYGLGAAATAIAFFSIPMVKAWLEMIFGYEWKKKFN